MKTKHIIGYLPHHLSMEHLKEACAVRNTKLADEGKGKTKLKPELFMLFFKHLMCKALYKSDYVHPFALFDYVQIHNDQLQKLFGEKLVKPYIDTMKEHNWIITKPHNKDKKKAREFRISTELVEIDLFDNSKLFSKVTITDKKSINAESKYKRYIHEEIISRFPENHRYLIDMLKQLRIDLTSKKAVSLIDELKLKDKTFGKSEYSYYNYLCGVNDRDIQYFKVDDFGLRLHSSWQTIKKQLRELIYFESYPNEKLKVIDIVNSQPFLSSYISGDVILNYFKDAVELAEAVDKMILENTNSLKHYQKLCLDGTIYEEWGKILKDSLGIKWRNVIGNIIRTKRSQDRDTVQDAELVESAEFRDAAKICFYRVIFGAQAQKDVLSNIFKHHFPAAWKIFKKCKEHTLFDNPKGNKNFTNLSCIMQRMESDLVLTRIGNKLIEHGIDRFLTIHDAVAVPAQFKLQSEQLMKEAFIEAQLPIPMLEKHEKIPDGLFGGEYKDKLRYHGYAAFSQDGSIRQTDFFTSMKKFLDSGKVAEDCYIQQYKDELLVATYNSYGVKLTTAKDWTQAAEKPVAANGLYTEVVYVTLIGKHPIVNDFSKIKGKYYKSKLCQWSFPSEREAYVRKALDRHGLLLSIPIYRKKRRKREGK